MLVLGMAGTPRAIGANDRSIHQSFSEQEITGTALEKVGNETSMSFTRPMKPTVAGKQALPSSESSTPTILLWAAGSDVTFGYHSLGRGAFTVDLLCADDQTAEVDEEQPDSEIVTTEPGSAPPLFTLAPSLSPGFLAFTASPSVAPVITPPQQEVDDTTNGAVPRVLQAGGGFLGLSTRDNLVDGFSRAVVFGIVVIGASAASTIIFRCCRSDVGKINSNAYRF